MITTDFVKIYRAKTNKTYIDNKCLPNPQIRPNVIEGMRNHNDTNKTKKLWLRRTLSPGCLSDLKLSLSEELSYDLYILITSDMPMPMNSTIATFDDDIYIITTAKNEVK